MIVGKNGSYTDCEEYTYYDSNNCSYVTDTRLVTKDRESVSFLKYNLDEIFDIAPASIEFAKLILHEGSGNNNSVNMDLKLVTQDWDENSITSAHINYIDNRYRGNRTIQMSTSAANISHEFDITTMLTDHLISTKGLNGGEHNYGFCLRTSASATSKHIFSAYNNNLNYTPKIVLSYSEPANLYLSGDIETFVSSLYPSIWYKFTPSKTDYYKIYTTGKVDTYGDLYLNKNTYVKSDDDSGNSTNFKIIEKLYADQTYYIKVRGYSSTTTGTFFIRIEQQNMMFHTSRTSSLKQDINNIIHNTGEIGGGFNNLSNSIDTVLSYDDLITSLCNTQGYTISKSYLQTLLFKEIWEYSLDGQIADSAVKSGIRDDSSTGLGQIFAKVAIGALNNAKILGLATEYDYMDETNPEDISQMWNLLHNDNEYNITMVYYEILNCAGKSGQPQMDFCNYTPAQVKAVLARYNGTGDAAADYGEEVYEYYLVFEKYKMYN